MATYQVSATVAVMVVPVPSLLCPPPVFVMVTVWPQWAVGTSASEFISR